MSSRGPPPSTPRRADEDAIFSRLVAGGWVDLLADAVVEALACDPRLHDFAAARVRDTKLFGLAPSEDGIPNGIGDAAEVSEGELERVTREVETALFAKAAELVWGYIGPGGDHVLARVVDEVVAGAACEVEAGGRGPGEGDRSGRGERGQGEGDGGEGFGSPSSSSSQEGGLPEGGAGVQVAAS